MKTTDRITPQMEQAPVTSGKKISYRLGYIALAVLAAACGLFLWWSFQSDKVLEVKNSPFPVRTIRPHPTADGVVILKVDICKHSDVVGRTRTSFISASREIFLPVAKEQLPKGCLNQEVPILIPSGTPAGTYKIKFTVLYKLNPLKSVTKEFETRPFVVDPKE